MGVGEEEDGTFYAKVVFWWPFRMAIKLFGLPPNTHIQVCRGPKEKPIQILMHMPFGLKEKPKRVFKFWAMNLTTQEARAFAVRLEQACDTMDIGSDNGNDRN